MPPILDENQEGYIVKLATAWCTALQSLGLGSVTLTSKGLLCFCRADQSVENQEQLNRIGVGEDDQPKKYFRQC